MLFSLFFWCCLFRSLYNLSFKIALFIGTYSEYGGFLRMNPCNIRGIINLRTKTALIIDVKRIFTETQSETIHGKYIFKEAALFQKAERSLIFYIRVNKIKIFYFKNLHNNRHYLLYKIFM